MLLNILIIKTKCIYFKNKQKYCLTYTPVQSAWTNFVETKHQKISFTSEYAYELHTLLVYCIAD